MLDRSSSPDDPLTRVIDQLAHLLPAQGPISIFIHHNTLHAFEHLPFEEAVERAAERLGANRSWPSRGIATSWRRAAFSPGTWRRCSTNSWAPAARSDVAGVGSRLDLWRAVVLHGIPAATGRELSWILEETDGVVAVPDRRAGERPVRIGRADASWTIAWARSGERCTASGTPVSRRSAAPARRRFPRRPLRFAIATGSWPCTASTPMPGSIHR